MYIHANILTKTKQQPNKQKNPPRKNKQKTLGLLNLKYDIFVDNL